MHRIQYIYFPKSTFNGGYTKCCMLHWILVFQGFNTVVRFVFCSEKGKDGTERKRTKDGDGEAKGQKQNLKQLFFCWPPHFKPTSWENVRLFYKLWLATFCFASWATHIFARWYGKCEEMEWNRDGEWMRSTAKNEANDSSKKTSEKTDKPHFTQKWASW